MSGRRWSRDRIDAIALRDPAPPLGAIERDTLSRAHLSHAAETIGRVGTPGGLPVLRSLLRHESPMVREGALHGLGYWLGGDADPEALAQVRAVAESDPVAMVRATAAEVIEELEAE